MKPYETALAELHELLDERITATTTRWDVRYQCPIDPETDQPAVDHHHDWDEVWISDGSGVTVASFGERYTAAPGEALHVARYADPHIAKLTLALVEQAMASSDDAVRSRAQVLLGKLGRRPR